MIDSEESIQLMLVDFRGFCEARDITRINIEPVDLSHLFDSIRLRQLFDIKLVFLSRGMHDCQTELLIFTEIVLLDFPDNAYDVFALLVPDSLDSAILRQ